MTELPRPEPVTARPHVIIIADQAEGDATSIRIQNFERDGKSFIPVFTSQPAFDALAGKSPYAEKGLSIDLEMLLAMLNGDEELVFNPGSDKPWRLTAGA